MSAEPIASVDLVIDADGLRRTGQALRSMEKYMEQMRKRAELLSRVRITPIVRLNDCLCGPIRAIRLKLTELTKRAWVVSIRAKFALDAKLLEQLKASVKVDVELNVKTNVLVRAMTQIGTAAGTPAAPEGSNEQGQVDPGAPSWLDKLADAAKQIGKEIVGVYKDRLLDHVKSATIDLIDKGIGRLSGVKGLGWLKAFLAPQKEEAGSGGGKADAGSGRGKGGGWLDKLKALGKEIASEYGSRLKEKVKTGAIDLIDKGIGRLSGIKGLGWLKAFLAPRKEEAGSGGGKADAGGGQGKGGASKDRLNVKVQCICQCKCKGSAYDRSGRDRSKAKGGRSLREKAGNLLTKGKRALGQAKDWVLGKTTGARQQRTGNLLTKGKQALGQAKGWVLGKALEVRQRAGNLLAPGKKLVSGAKNAVKGAASAAARGAGKALTFGKNAVSSLAKVPLKSAAKGLFKWAGKAVRPLSFAMDAVNIATAKPGKARNKAIGSAIGGNVGAVAFGALGTLVAPGVGTAIGATVGGIAGDWLGGKIGEAVGSLQKLNPFKKKKAPTPTPTPTDAFGARSDDRLAASHTQTQVSSSTHLNIQIPAGAVQLSMRQDLDYDAIAHEIGVRMAASIKQSVENRV